MPSANAPKEAPSSRSESARRACACPRANRSKFFGSCSSVRSVSATADYGDVATRVANLTRESNDLLLERLAGRIADEVLTIDRVEGVEVTVTKLRPPIPETLDSTAVRILRHRQATEITEVAERGSHLAIIALGSNLGDRAGYLRHAVESLPGVTRQSLVYETDPVGGPDGQGAYLNMVVSLRTTLDPYALLRRCQRIEAEAQRERVVVWGPRTLDIDVLFYDDIAIDDSTLTIPHPLWAERSFVLSPLSDVAPERCPAGWEQSVPSLGVRAIGPLESVVVV